VCMGFKLICKRETGGRLAFSSGRQRGGHKKKVKILHEFKV
jgi:hypothetical protein